MVKLLGLMILIKACKTMKNTIENKERVFDLVNKLLNTYGTPQEMYDQIDEAEYCYVGYLCSQGYCLNDSHFIPVQVIRGLKEFLKEIDEIRNKD